MAIPTTLPLSMSTIKTELGLSGSQSLTACFAAATGTFNATYEGSKDRITNFRGYSHITTYYRLIGCGGVSNAWTTQAPLITNQRYIDLSGGPAFYYHNGTTTTTLPSPLVTTNLVTGVTFCP